MLKVEASYEINLKMDLEIMRLHRKIDELREKAGVT